MTGSTMLGRLTASNGTVYFISPLLSAAGVIHAFSTRIGGVSHGEFASMNLGNPGEGDRDSDENIRVNFGRLQEAIGCPGGGGTLRAWVRQVHGRQVELIEREPEGEYAETLEAEVRDRFSGQVSADGLVCVVPRVLLTVRVADCVPVLLASGDGAVVAAVHAGWRGVMGNIVERAVRAIGELGGTGIVAAIGPAISVEHFEVGEEVADEFRRRELGGAVRDARDGGKPHIDLQWAVRIQLERAGVTGIDGNELCTFRDAELFYSHRRERGRTGRMAAVITRRMG